MSFLSDASVVCEFRAWLHGEFTDDAVAAVDRLFNNLFLLEDAADSPATQAALDAVRDKAWTYARDSIDEHVPLLRDLRDAEGKLDNPCLAINAFLALVELDAALDILASDNAAGNIDAGNRVRALAAAGEALNRLGNLMAAVQVLKPFGDFLAAFVAEAWEPFSASLGVYFQRLEWLDNFDPVDGAIGPQPG
jgi:hypothetical protein